ncbi:MAG: small ribosomal subunit Rsm22 family protein [Sandaracinaceae bacterium]
MSPPLALDSAWLDLLDELGPALLGARDRTGEALEGHVAAASALYTRDRHRLGEVGLAARLRFFFPRDLPKVEGPLAELHAAGALPSGPWRVLDIGAGLGTTSLGAAGYAKRLGVPSVQIHAVERDTASLDAFVQLAREAQKAGLVPPISLTSSSEDLETLNVASLPEADLIVFGLALNELFVDRSPSDRRAALETLIAGLSTRLAPGGALIVLEPAMRDGTRELMRLRDRFEARPDVAVFGPCLRDGPCPLLRRERDWCHAELALALPDRLAALARGAGLRWEKLTYAYLTLRNGPRAWDGDARVWRVVGGPVATKGKTEWDLCGGHGLVRIRRLERERSENNAGLDEARRGARLRIEQPLADGDALRARPGVSVQRVD